MGLFDRIRQRLDNVRTDGDVNVVAVHGNNSTVHIERDREADHRKWAAADAEAAQLAKVGKLIEELRPAAAAGDVECMVAIADLEGKRGATESMWYWVGKAAHHGDLKSLLLVLGHHRLEDPVHGSYNYILFLKQAANLGMVDAIEELIRISTSTKWKGSPFVGSEWCERLSLIQSARCGNVPSMERLVQIYVHNGADSRQEAAKWLAQIESADPSNHLLKRYRPLLRLSG